MWKTWWKLGPQDMVTALLVLTFAEWIRHFACWICISVLLAVCTSWVVSKVCVVLFFRKQVHWTCDVTNCPDASRVPLHVFIVLKYNTADVVWKLQAADLPAGSVLEVVFRMWLPQRYCIVFLILSSLVLLEVKSWTTPISKVRGAYSETVWIAVFSSNCICRSMTPS